MCRLIVMLKAYCFMYAVAENFSNKLSLVSNLEAVGSLVVLHDTYLQRIFLTISAVNYDRFFVPDSISKLNFQDYCF